LPIGNRLSRPAKFRVVLIEKIFENVNLILDIN